MPSTSDRTAVIATSALMSGAGAILPQKVLSFLHLVFLFVLLTVFFFCCSYVLICQEGRHNWHLKSARPYGFSCLHVYKTISLSQTTRPSFSKNSSPCPVIAFTLPELLGGKNDCFEPIFDSEIKDKSLGSGNSQLWGGIARSLFASPLGITLKNRVTGPERLISKYSFNGLNSWW